MDGTAPVTLTTHRDEGGPAAVLFVHGFASSGVPFGELPSLLAEDEALAGWDLYGLGYSTGLAPDLRGLWEADPSIPMLSTYLRSHLRVEPLDRYQGLAIVAHSMGGLVVQRALLDEPEMADRATHVFFFGTPSNGLRLARWGRFLKSQVSDMAERGPFISDLRRDWEQQFGGRRPFDLWVVAGDRDAFVPPESSLSPFPPETHLVVPGNHLELVAASDAASMSRQVIGEALAGASEPAGPWNAARVAVETTDYDRAIRRLGPHAAELDERHLVDLALALDGTGRRAEAIDLLRAHSDRSATNSRGVLAGRLKRNWMASGRRADAEEALALYSDALGEATAAADHSQVHYHAINVSYLEIAFRGDTPAGVAAAQMALAACRQVPQSYWRAATEAEALLYLDRPDEAVAAYRDALALEPDPTQLESTCEQALAACEAMGRRDVARHVAEVFRTPYV